MVVLPPKRERSDVDDERKMGGVDEEKGCIRGWNACSFPYRELRRKRQPPKERATPQHTTAPRRQTLASQGKEQSRTPTTETASDNHESSDNQGKDKHEILRFQSFIG